LPQLGFWPGGSGGWGRGLPLGRPSVVSNRTNSTQTQVTRWCMRRSEAPRRSRCITATVGKIRRPIPGSGFTTCRIVDYDLAVPFRDVSPTPSRPPVRGLFFIVGAEHPAPLSDGQPRPRPPTPFCSTGSRSLAAGVPNYLTRGGLICLRGLSTRKYLRMNFPSRPFRGPPQ
jgi:hypothetical protein